MAELTHDDLDGMTLKQIAKHFGVPAPKPGTKRVDFIQQVIAATTQPVTLGTETKTVKLGKVDITKEGRFLPAIVVQGTEPDIFIRYTPLGGGKWREENSPYNSERETDGGADALWDGTELVIPNAIYVDEADHPQPFDPYVAPYVREGDDG